MKTPVGKVAVFAAWALALSPLDLVAQNIASQPGHVNRSVETFTLLPGPTLLSPGHAPQATPKIAIRPAAPESSTSTGQWRFVPSYLDRGTVRFKPAPATNVGAGKLVLRENRPDEIKAPQGKPSLSPDLLRFDATLHSPSEPLKTEAVPAPRKD